MQLDDQLPQAQVKQAEAELSIARASGVMAECSALARGDRLVAALLAFLLGWLGVHRFYLGRIGSGIAMLLLSCTLIGLLVTVLLAVAGVLLALDRVRT